MRGTFRGRRGGLRKGFVNRDVGMMQRGPMAPATQNGYNERMNDVYPQQTVGAIGNGTGGRMEMAPGAHRTGYEEVRRQRSLESAAKKAKDLDGEAREVEMLQRPPSDHDQQSQSPTDEPPSELPQANILVAHESHGDASRKRKWLQ